MAADWKRWVIGRRPSRTLLRALGWAIAAYLTFGVALRVVRVQGESMAPTVRNGSVRLINQLRFRYAAPRRGDIVTIRVPGSDDRLLKRVLALPGEEVRFENGVFFVNGQPLAEPYVKIQGRWTTGVYRLGPDEYYVAGDNRGGEYRHHATGIVQRGEIRGALLW